MTDKMIISVLENNQSFFVKNNFFLDILHLVGWGLIKLLNMLCDICQSLYDTVFKLLDFTTWPTFNTYFETFKVVFVAILTLSLVALGIILIVDHEKKPKIFINICLASLVFTSSTVILTDLNKIVISGKKAILGSPSSSNDIIRDNLYDLVRIDEKYGLKNMDSNKEKNLQNYKYSKLSDKTISSIDINQLLNYKSSFMTTSEGKEILKKKLITGKIDNNGKASYSLEEIDNGYGWNSEDDTDLFNEFYYRYKVDYLPCLIGQISVALVFFFMSYKVVRLTYEIAIHRVLALLYSANLTGTQKTVKILEEIKNQYIVLLVTALVVKIFLLMQTYLSVALAGKNLLRSLILILVALSAVLGSDLIQKLTGIDAGLSSGMGLLYAGYHIAKGSVHFGISAIKGGISMGKGAANVGNKLYNHFNQKHNTDALSDMNGNTSNSLNENSSTHNTSNNNASSNSSNLDGNTNQNDLNHNVENGKNGVQQQNTNSNIEKMQETQPGESNTLTKNDSNLIDTANSESLEKPSINSGNEKEQLTGFNPDLPNSSNQPDMKKMDKDLSSLSDNSMKNTSSIKDTQISTPKSQILKDNFTSEHLTSSSNLSRSKTDLHSQGKNISKSKTDLSGVRTERKLDTDIQQKK